MENLKSLYTANGNVKWFSSMKNIEKQWPLLKKLKKELCYDSKNSIPRYTGKECVFKFTPLNVHCGIITIAKR